MRLVTVNRLPGELKGAHFYSYLGSAAISILQAFSTTVEEGMAAGSCGVISRCEKEKLFSSPYNFYPNFLRPREATFLHSVTSHLHIKIIVMFREPSHSHWC